MKFLSQSKILFLLTLSFVSFNFGPFSAHASTSKEALEKAGKLLETKHKVISAELGHPKWRFESAANVEEAMSTSVSYEEVLATKKVGLQILKLLKQVTPTDLKGEDVWSYDIIQREAQRLVSEEKFYWLNFPVVPYLWNFSAHRNVLPGLSLKTEAELATYLDNARRIPLILAQVLTKLKGQVKRGIVIPSPALKKVIPMLQAEIKPGLESSYFPEAARINVTEEAALKKFREEMVDLIENEINPKLTDIVTYLSSTAYMSKAPTTVGLWQYPQGKEYYQYLIKLHSGLDMTPEEVHAFGLSEVKRIQAEMAEIRKELNFTGSEEDFNKLLKEDPKFYAKTPEEVGAIMQGFVDSLSTKVGEFFSLKPQAEYGVRRAPLASEAGMTFGFYNPPSPIEPKGYYYFNGSNLDQRPTLKLESLIYHELIPGHHFQIVLQLENSRNLPDFRKSYSTYGYQEGWGEYSASFLAKKMGGFKDPYSKYGDLLHQMFAAMRLVTDSGMNFYGWSLEQAQEYMRRHIIESDLQIRSDLLRYSTDLPGQALAYNLGMNEFIKLHNEAKHALGGAFDIKEFHRVVLESSQLPFSSLRKKVQIYIKAKAGAR